MNRLAVPFLALVGVLGVLWWVALVVRPGLGSFFLPPDVPPGLIRTFLAADLCFFAAGPLAAAHGLRLNKPWARPMLSFVAGGILYAALWGWGLVLVTGSGLWGALLMTPPALLTPWFAWRRVGDRAN